MYLYIYTFFLLLYIVRCSVWVWHPFVSFFTSRKPYQRRGNPLKSSAAARRPLRREDVIRRATPLAAAQLVHSLEAGKTGSDYHEFVSIGRLIKPRVNNI